MVGGFRMEGDNVRAGFQKVANHAVNRRNHQMHINRRLNAVFFQRLADARAKGQIRHIVVVHHVKVDNICAGLQHIFNVFA